MTEPASNSHRQETAPAVSDGMAASNLNSGRPEIVEKESVLDQFLKRLTTPMIVPMQQPQLSLPASGVISQLNHLVDKTCSTRLLAEFDIPSDVQGRAILPKDCLPVGGEKESGGGFAAKANALFPDNHGLATQWVLGDSAKPTTKPQTKMAKKGQRAEGRRVLKI